MDNAAGKNVMDSAHASSTPVAVMFPSSWKGGDSLKFSTRKPIAVVRLVRNTGIALIRMLSLRALILSAPFCISLNMLMRICTESAIANVITTIGDAMLAGFIP